MPETETVADETEMEVPASAVAFDRPLVCILGLPFDAVTLDEAVQRVRGDAFAGRRCFISTPNLNFAIGARSDAAFRGSVLRSDLSLVDGMPLVWIARALRLPVAQRVSGSDLFEALQTHAGPALNVFLFGGPDGAGALACQTINRRGGGLRCVGFESPGFGSIESMSNAACIDRINRSGAHFVVVALGAKKGQAWIEHNASRLNAPLLSHLGAVVNFAAGTVKRAPRWLQWSGLEWAWRIKEEPALWRRYASDALELSRLLVSRVLPDAIASRREPGRLGASDPARIDTVERGADVLIRMHGRWHRGDANLLREQLSKCVRTNARMVLDMTDVSAVDNRIVAILLVARAWFDRRHGMRIIGVERSVASSIRFKLAESLLCEEHHLDDAR